MYIIHESKRKLQLFYRIFDEMFPLISMIFFSVDNLITRDGPFGTPKNKIYLHPKTNDWDYL